MHKAPVQNAPMLNNFSAQPVSPQQLQQQAYLWTAQSVFPQQLQKQGYLGNSSQAPMIANYPINYISLLPQSAPPSSTTPNQPQAMIAGSTTTPSSSWFPDSGASHHVTSNVQNIQRCVPFEGSDQVIIGNGQGLPINSIGSSSFLSPFNSNVILKGNLRDPIRYFSSKEISVLMVCKNFPACSQVLLSMSRQALLGLGLVYIILL